MSDTPTTSPITLTPSPTTLTEQDRNELTDQLLTSLNKLLNPPTTTAVSSLLSKLMSTAPPTEIQNNEHKTENKAITLVAHDEKSGQYLTNTFTAKTDTHPFVSAGNQLQSMISGKAPNVVSTTETNVSAVYKNEGKNTSDNNPDNKHVDINTATVQNNV
jgi:hypothetical protein